MSDSLAAALPPSGNVIVSAERLAELEKLERETMDKKKQSIEKLKQYEKENPELHRKRSSAYYANHKEEILAKKREKYKAKKEAATKSRIETP
jgi:transketolase